jgi:predicted ATPase
MEFRIKNFRSIQDQAVELAPITVIYGPNGAGKSSLLYALVAFKNLVLNPNRRVDEFFNLNFINLGNFEAVVFDHDLREQMGFSLSFARRGADLTYRIKFDKDTGEFSLLVRDKETVIDLHLAVSFPYPANASTSEKFVYGESTFTVNWNGITAQVQADPPSPEMQEVAIYFTTLLNAPIEVLRTVGIVPLQRGFSKPFYSTTPLSPMLITEDEVASVLANHKYLVAKVSHYLEQIVERDFRLNSTLGTAIFSLDATDKSTGVATELVNEGYGVNQLVYFLARTLHADSALMCVEEPEVHLHPSIVRKLAKVMVAITREEHKRFLISTHSETFLTALLALVAKKELNTSDLMCYMVHKRGKVTEFEPQSVNENGQIEGGLANFVQGEMEDVMAFLRSAK